LLDDLVREPALAGLLYRIKRELGGIYKKGCRCYERLRAKAGGGESLEHTRWSGEMGYLRKGKWIRDEKFVSGRGECVCEAIGAS
jgi:hypothetical protein